MIKELKFGEIKKLIELCEQKGVSEFVLGDMRVVFRAQTKVSLQTPAVVQTKAAEDQTQQVEKIAFREMSRDIDEEDLALMQIEDPIRYEQMLIEGELEDDRSGHTSVDEQQSAIDSRLTEKTH